MRDRLVTLFGGGGFVGRYVAQALIKRGARVRVAQRNPKAAYFLRPQGGLGQTQFVAADVRRPDSIARAVSGADAVVNLVGTFGANIEAVQADGPGLIARAAAAAGVQSMVHVSAIGADEGSDITYFRTKGAGEAAARAALPGTVILRPSMIFGREDQFTNRFAGLIRALPVVPVIRGNARFQPVYVADVAAAVAAALADGGHDGRTYELGGPEVMSMLQFNQAIAAITGRSPSFVELPDAVSRLIARAGFLPGAPITYDQWRMLGIPNVVGGGAAGLEALGVAATPLAAVAPDWLVIYRRHGRFATDAAAR
ncbi:NADH dehydrogenase [Sphingomonas jejuensis]|uniref:NADH dehydrogenase n=1 Tax=Sphingomonas jejuensis TaxID=904715 RepID=A0ABX0XP66_9SPHN|nr:complex I NDUFA9 subunit family protein [Sphingomonas jejuensis]NJC35186.1 NADH dehydrogenase [Sphingomonas jejuensis]